MTSKRDSNNNYYAVCSTR